MTALLTDVVVDAVARAAAARGHHLGVPVWTQVRGDLLDVGAIRRSTIPPWPRSWP